MKGMLAFVVLVAFASCTTEVKKQFGKADDLTIYFYTSEGTDSIYKIVHTTDEKAINKLLDFMEPKNALQQSCAYNGRILLKKGNHELGVVQFNVSNPSCRIFSYTLNGKEIRTRMSNEAADFLIALREGRNFY